MIFISNHLTFRKLTNNPPHFPQTNLTKKEIAIGNRVTPQTFANFEIVHGKPLEFCCLNPKFYAMHDFKEVTVKYSCQRMEKCDTAHEFKRLHF